MVAERRIARLVARPVLADPRAALAESFEQRRVPSVGCDYRDFYANVRDAILERAELAVTTEWSLNIMRMLELARASSQERRTIQW